jgi:uncharacterized hydrophobic protein (TIGR00271 family)
MEENKFNFSEEENKQNQNIEQSKEAIREDAKGLFLSLKQFLFGLLDFRPDIDRDVTIDAIKLDIPFRGATAWILICSIFVASVGLNANSTAVVIGAMLISPLMGPILGIGLSVAINDIDTLRKSLINFGVMIVLSIITAFLFFWIFPLSEETSELLGRTRPDIRDVLIAFFGGLALIIARTKKGTIATVIFGVAIATALMPPLCTVGYGLALSLDDFDKGMSSALGAMYLFTINAIFIALATFLVLKLLRFPMLKYANSKKRKRTARIASYLAILAMIPAGFTFVNVLNESNFKRAARNFIKKELVALPHHEYIKKNAFYEFSKDNISYIELNTFGLDQVPESTIAVLENRMRTEEYKSLNETKLIFNQNKFKNIDNLKYMEELRYRDSLDILSQTQKIKFLEDKVTQMAELERNYIAFEELTQEVKINYENIEQFSYSNVITSNFTKMDTLLVFTVKWNKESTTQDIINKDKERLERWLKVKLNLDTLVVKSVD